MEVRKLRHLAIAAATVILLGSAAVGLFGLLSSGQDVEPYAAAPPSSLVGRTSFALVDVERLSAPPLSDAQFRALHDQARKDGDWLIQLDAAQAAAVGGRTPAVIDTLRSLLGEREDGRVDSVTMQEATSSGAIVSIIIVWDTPNEASPSTQVPITATYAREGDGFRMESLSSALAADDIDEDEGVE